MDKPKCLIDGHLNYLDALRESGVTNMFGAQPYLLRRFPTLTLDESGEVLKYWMRTFGERHPA